MAAFVLNIFCSSSKKKASTLKCINYLKFKFDVRFSQNPEKQLHWHDSSLKIFSKNGAKVGDLYDNNRDIFKSPMPHKVTKVVISLGGQDLEDPSLLTLKEASLGDLKQKNKPLLEKKTCSIFYL